MKKKRYKETTKLNDFSELGKVLKLEDEKPVNTGTYIVYSDGSFEYEPDVEKLK